jgi:hypothetical protein
VSARSREAQALARELSSSTEVRVEITYERPGEWRAHWGDGPTRDQMGTLIDQLQRSGRYPQMASQRINTSRWTSGRAWAARAIAADREGTLRPMVAAGVADRAANPYIVRMTGDRLTPADHALLACIEDVLEVTAYPDRPGAPEDIPAIERLVAAGADSEFRMAPLLLAADVAALGELPAGVTALHDRRRRAGQ